MSGMDLLKLSALLLVLYAAGRSDAQVLPDGTVDGLLGSNVTLTMMDTKFITLTWKFSIGTGPLEPVVALAPGGVTVGVGFQGRARVNRTTGSLTIGPLKATDGGKYTYDVVDDMANAHAGDVTLRVLVPVSDVRITANATDAVEINSTVVLNCSAKGSLLKFSWLNGTNAIVADGTHLIQTDDVSFSLLTVVGVLRTDLAEPIYCTAAHSLGMAKSAPFNHTVHYGPELIAMTAFPSTEVIRKGSNITLTCSAKSRPPALLTWYQNDQLLPETGPTLVLPDVKLKHSGSYSCVAQNAKTMRSIRSSATRFVVHEAIYGVVINVTAGNLVASNHTANLSCQATEGSMVTRKWMKDNTPLSPSNHVMISNDLSVVTIRPVSREDNGEYKCLVSNPINTESATTVLVVNYGPENIKVTGQSKVEVKKAVVLVCSADSLPAATYSWKFNDTATAVTTANYTIPEAADTHSGRYTCEAYNAITGRTAMQTHNLSVKAVGDLDEGLSGGAIAGIVIGVIILLLLLITCCCCCCRSKQPIESPY